jgi:hypothetical protein
MAGLLRRKIADAPDAQAVLTEIINEVKMANAIVQEVLDFVRPIRPQVDYTAIADAVQGAVQLAATRHGEGQWESPLPFPTVCLKSLTSAWPADGPSGRRRATGQRLRACNAASSTAGRARATPGSRAGRRLVAADA